MTGLWANITFKQYWKRDCGSRLGCGVRRPPPTFGGHPKHRPREVLIPQGGTSSGVVPIWRASCGTMLAVSTYLSADL